MHDLLAGLLLRDGAAAPDRVEEALERRELLGGALDTNLLEVDAVDEAKLAPFLARASGLPLAPAVAFAHLDPKACARIAPELGARYLLVPLAFEGRTLHAGTTFPVDAALAEEVGAQLGLILRPYVACEFRVRLAVEALWGVPADRRFHLLAARFGGVAIPPAALAATPGPARALEAPPAASTPGPAGALAARIAAATPGPPRPAPTGATPGPAAPVSARGTPGPSGGLAVPLPAPDAAGASPARPALDPAPVVRALAGAASFDDALGLVVRFVRERFAFAAGFAVLGGAAVGWDAAGPAGDERPRIRRKAIELGRPSILRTVIETGGHFLGPVSGDHEVLAFLSDLGRGAPRTVLCLPASVGGRALAVLLAEDGPAPIDPDDVAAVTVAVGALGASLGSLIATRRTPAVATETPGGLPPEPGPGTAETGTIAVAPAPRVHPARSRQESAGALPGAVHPALAADLETARREVERVLAAKAPERPALLDALAQAAHAPAAAELLVAMLVRDAGAVPEALRALGGAAVPALLRAAAAATGERHRAALGLLGPEAGPVCRTAIEAHVRSPDPALASAAGDLLRRWDGAARP